jgi:hypothetical protein
MSPRQRSSAGSPPLRSNGIFTQSSSAVSKIGRTTKPVRVDCYIYRCKALLPLYQVYTNFHRQRCELLHSVKVRPKMVLSCRSKRNLSISDTIQSRTWSYRLNIRYRVCIVQNAPPIHALQAWYSPRCILSTVVRDSCEPPSMVLMLTQKQSDSRPASSYSAYTDMLPECDRSMYQTR